MTAAAPTPPASCGGGKGVARCLTHHSFIHSPLLSRQIKYPKQQPPTNSYRLGLPHHRLGSSSIHCASWRGEKTTPSPFSGSAFQSNWDKKPYETPRSGKIVYLDELDIATFLDPPKELIPLDSSSYNPASYLWKKIGDIPEERRHRLLSLLNPRLISRAWEIAGMRYDDPKLSKKSASSLLSDNHGSTSLEFWKCRTSGGYLL